MKIILASISSGKLNATNPASQLSALYIERAARYTPSSHRLFADEEKFLDFVEATSARTRPYLLLADRTGQQVSSPELATLFAQLLDNGTQTLILAIGPANGWSPAAHKRADRMIAFGRITLPHELAAVVAAEQLYRALTIRAGHPYHTGH